MNKEILKTKKYDFSNLAKEKLSCLDLNILEMINGISFDDILYEHIFGQYHQIFRHPLPECCYRPCEKSVSACPISIHIQNENAGNSSANTGQDEFNLEKQLIQSVERLIQYDLVQEKEHRFYSKVKCIEDMLLMLHQKRVICETMKEHLGDLGNIYGDLWDKFDKEEN